MKLTDMSHLLRETILGVTMALLPTPPVYGAGPTYTIINHPISEPPRRAFLGHSVAVLDWNTDGVLDIAGGAPGENRTYVFLGPDFTKHEVVTVDRLAQDDRFGNKITAGNLDGLAGDELVVAAPGAKVGDFDKAGTPWQAGLMRRSYRKRADRSTPSPGRAGLGASCYQADLAGGPSSTRSGGTNSPLSSELPRMK